MKTAKIILSSIKDPDGWMELVHILKFEQFETEHIGMDEDFNIVGGKIL
ncbi:MAG: hypothetical protein M0R17_13400 [Candidatus Omnitrophica bacterium]|jgi:hypothetical protein|nr:hypothetical protein [Candidatus Omnitrophota bacterium]